jgi:hypothetical protein
MGLHEIGVITACPLISIVRHLFVRRRGFASHDAEQVGTPEYDAMFPEHPLSRARWV